MLLNKFLATIPQISQAIPCDDAIPCSLFLCWLLAPWSLLSHGIANVEPFIRLIKLVWFLLCASLHIDLCWISSWFMSQTLKTARSCRSHHLYYPEQCSASSKFCHLSIQPFSHIFYGQIYHCSPCSDTPLICLWPPSPSTWAPWPSPSPWGIFCCHHQRAPAGF